MKKINVAIADDQILFRKGMAAIINSLNDTQITIEADNGKTLIEALQASETKPDIVLLDL